MRPLEQGSKRATTADDLERELNAFFERTMVNKR